jgi:hypothetical protein
MDRAQSEVLSFVLVVGFVVVGATGILLSGTVLVDETRDQIKTGQAEFVFQQAASDIELAAQPDSGARAVSFDVHQGSPTVHETGWVRIDGPDGTIQKTLGHISYAEEDGETVVYEAGAVFRYSNGEPEIVTRPSFYKTNDTVTNGIMTVSGEASRGTVTATQTNVASSRAVIDNPVSDELEVTIKSPHYDAWAKYLTTQFEPSKVVTDPSNDQVTVTLDPTAGDSDVGEGIAMTAPGDLVITGNARPVDAYNSSEGDYSSTETDEGELATIGDVSLRGSARVEGDVRSGGEVTGSGASSVTGTVYYTDDADAHFSDTEEIDGVDGMDAIDAKVQNRINDLRTGNDNTGLTSNEKIDGSGTIDAGEYYVDEISLDGGDHVVFDTSGGDIHVAVDGNADISGNGGGDARMSVVGDGEVRFYTNGDQWTFDRADVSVPGDNSSQFWIRATQDTSFTVEKASIVGIIFAPSDGTAGSFEISGSGSDPAEMFGGVVSSEVEIGQHGTVHYDLALDSSNDAENVVQDANFVHVAITEIELES